MLIDYLEVIIDLLLIGFAQFASVFSLVLNSKLLRDDRWILAMANSWMISATQFTFVWVVSQTQEHDRLLTFIAAAFGGSVGCAIGHLFYTHKVLRG